MSDRVRGHHQFVSVETREQVSGDVFIPRGLLLGLAATLHCPLRRERAMDDVNNFDQEGCCAGGRIEDLDKRRFGIGFGRDFEPFVALGHIGPSRGVG